MLNLEDSLAITQNFVSEVGGWVVWGSGGVVGNLEEGEEKEEEEKEAHRAG